jgi:hypothetical protein
VIRLGAVLLAVAAAAPAQESRRVFELLLPDFQDAPFTGGTVIDVPDRPIQNLSVQVVGASELGINPGAVQVKVNGKGLGNALNRVANEKGILLVMTPFTLGMRPDQLFDARENTVEAVAQDRRGRRFYQNWIVRVNESQRNQLFTYTSAVSPDDPRAIPPDIVVSEPKAPPVLGLAEQSAKVRLLCTISGAGTTFSVNGVAVGKPSPQAVATVDHTVVVTRASKEIVLEAADARGNRRGVRIPVIVQEKAAPRVRFAGSRYAVVVGISQYGPQAGAPPALASAAADAKLLAAELESRAKFPKANIQLLVDEGARAERIQVALSDFAAKAQADDLLLIFVAAHGLHDPTRPENLYLAPFGAQMEQLRATAIEFGDFERLLNQSVRSNNTLLVFDMGHRVEGGRIAGGNLINRYLLNLFSDQEGRAVLVSGGVGQVSGTAAGKASGALAHWLVEALAGKADGNRDNVVTAEELFRYVAEQVRAESQGAQTPRFRLATRSAGAPVAELAAAAPRAR